LAKWNFDLIKCAVYYNELSIHVQIPREVCTGAEEHSKFGLLDCQDQMFQLEVINEKKKGNKRKWGEGERVLLMVYEAVYHYVLV
jgi:hypothetical protein